MLSIENLTYRIAGREILVDASARLPAGRRIGLVGRNGTGKTTLLKLVLGELAPDLGDIVKPNGWRVGSVAQEAPASNVSLVDTVLAADPERLALLEAAEIEHDGHRLGDIHTRLEAIDAYSAPSRAASILSGLGFSAADQERPCREFSGGWRMRVALAAILFAAPDLLLLDEPTNYLDLEGVLWLEEYLRRYRGSVLIVSHDRDLLNSVAEFILHLEGKKLTLYTGDFETFVETREARRALDAAFAKKQEAARKHMQEFVDRFRYKASKARQAQSRLKMLSRLKPIELTIEDHIAAIRLPKPQAASPPLVTFDHAAVGYVPGVPVLQNIAFRIDPDDRIALLGKNGNGKSTLAKLLAGKLETCGGEIVRARKFVPGYFAQHQLEELDGSITPVETLARVRPKLTVTELRTQLGGFGLAADKAVTKVGNLSGGERARLMLALATLDKPNLLILDEPTNHLDIDAREQLLTALNEFEGAVVLISHDRRLIEGSVDRLLLVADGTVKPFDGDIEDYRKWLLDSRRSTPPREDRPNKSERRQDSAGRRKQLKPLKDKADTAEADIAKLTKQLAYIDGELAAPDLFARDPVKAARLGKQRADIADRLAAAEALWVDAAAEYEAAVAEG
ncbi:MAG: ABC-F family ATP-binding cassette domain-containing protein [Rhizomicrobium sp.]|jgi:ATP-binding cassette subfamily F protein 3